VLISAWFTLMSSQHDSHEKRLSSLAFVLLIFIRGWVIGRRCCCSWQSLHTSLLLTIRVQSQQAAQLLLLLLLLLCVRACEEGIRKGRGGEKKM
jgi:hypothetical protein